MSSNLRLGALVALLVSGLALVFVVTRQHTATPLSGSLAPAFQLIGEPIKSLDHLVTRIIPVSDMDERDFGLVLGARYEEQLDEQDSVQTYLSELIKHLTVNVTKPFDYRVYLIDRSVPNAMAFPGGVILVSKGLLETLQSESELAAVLAHEIGHIELGHCLDAVKFKLLADKIGAREFGEITDFAVRLLLSHSFSKTQENAADEYAFDLILTTHYDPYGVGRAFASLLQYKNRESKAESQKARLDPVRDYFLSHPPLALREATFNAKAKKWWRINSAETRYLGVDNLGAYVTIYAEHSLSPL